jgi:hypothetical protein
VRRAAYAGVHFVHGAAALLDDECSLFGVALHPQALKSSSSSSARSVQRVAAGAIALRRGSATERGES